MKNLLRLTDLTKEAILDIFRIADEIQEGQHRLALSGKTVVMFFPESSIRTRVTFEKGIYLLGGQTILFPPTALDKKEAHEDVVGYLNNWADAMVIRHKDMEVLETFSRYSSCSIINAMTSINHPCEILSDLYALSKRRPNFLEDEILFVGEQGNIGLAWKEAATVLGLKFSQCCPAPYKMADVNWYEKIDTAIIGKDVVCTDGIPKEFLEDFKDNQVTLDVMKKANTDAILNPCPPFFRGEEVSEDVIDSPYFVGYDFKKNLMEVQQAILIYCLSQ